MRKSSRVLRAGTRSSKLALVQARSALRNLQAALPGIAFEEVHFSSPGDRDRASDLQESPPDFFTRDLDQALSASKLDCAIHSAKDLPEPMPAELDWCWLPWREDPRDALVLSIGKGLAELPAQPRLGVSSARRADYGRKRFPKAHLLPIRGDIEDRLAQLDAGAYDLALMAGAALRRLGLDDRIAEWIPLA
ncbi:MAG: hydroxymethylbilane synthase, partial [Lentisphaerae bacterium]|nr:hydroxymethylbilane synthase [Lentisphaerota bacterium]